MADQYSQYSEPPVRHVAAVVVGSGASGIAVVGNLLERLSPDAGIVAWVDPRFQGGRINAKYREVPSNTKVSTFLEYAEAVEPFRRIIETTSKPNAITTLASLARNDTCSLRYAGDMLQMLSDGLLESDRVACYKSTVTNAEKRGASLAWSLTLQDDSRLEAPMVVYCTGSEPTAIPLPPSISQSVELLELDVSLKPSLLSKTLPRDRDLCIGVVGASHSAILVLMNLFSLSQDSHPRLRVLWFSRAKHLKYAEEMDGWILYDNTGLKGTAAEFAREHLDGDRLLHRSDVGKVITRIDCFGGPDQERQAQLREFPNCDYIVQAIGYHRVHLPSMKQDITYDHETGGFIDSNTNAPLPGLFGAGIAFPERVVDPYGNVEYAVGLIKFMKFLKRVISRWEETSLKQ
ncbi:pyridine nucleotide-disulfide oxidoreductase-domain-containing protein [Hypoxylon fuscum]|nr:pyridine nucleotide-disulfide oxidoreductase-domain-containing protein [Hypoxylon fuscum]